MIYRSRSLGRNNEISGLPNRMTDVRDGFKGHMVMRQQIMHDQQLEDDPEC